MDFHLLMIFFQVVVFLFAISVHESAHAWMANRCGDPTAMMLGRITLNPVKHIDPIGTLLLPTIALLYNVPLIGWAKPCPVNPRNFRNYVWDDIKTTLAGPLSNLLVASGALLCLLVVAVGSSGGKYFVLSAATGNVVDTSNPLMPVALLLNQAVVLNIILAVFNCIPVPPLDGSHVIRHLLPAAALRIYDNVGVFGLLILMLLGGRIIGALAAPFLLAYHFILAVVLGAR